MYDGWMFIKSILVIILLVLLGGFVRTAELGFFPEQSLFWSGRVPETLPEGVYKGTVRAYAFSWQGKKFAQPSNSGINLFKGSNGVVGEQYPFATSVGLGVHDYETKVIRIDYNLSTNPLWLRPVLDEIVEISPGHYLGKLELRIVPYFPFTLTYFELQK